MLPTGWPKFPKTGKPEQPASGLASRLVREIVSSAYVPSVYGGRVDWNALNQDERYACAATKWFKTVSRLQYHGTGGPKSSRTELSIRRMFGCPTAGYLWEGYSGGPVLTCSTAICPYCYARRVAVMFTDLCVANSRRPDGAKIWISSFYLVDGKKAFLDRVRRIRPAAASLMYHPIGTTPDDDKWLIRGVMLTDDRRKVHGRKYVRRIYNQSGIVKSLSAWMTYPVGWYRLGLIRTAGKMVDLFSQLKPGIQKYSVLGACRDDFVPGSSWFDFKGNDKLIAGYSPREVDRK